MGISVARSEAPTTRGDRVTEHAARSRAPTIETLKARGDNVK